MASGEMPGFNHNKNGTKKREVCSNDIESPEAAKIISIHARTGAQYFTNGTTFGITKKQCSPR